MRYMIHAAPLRMWYVNEFLIPSMKKQGIDEKDILVWNDTEGKGNLFSCMEAFKYCGENIINGTWHIQDDIIIAPDFKKKTDEWDGCVNKIGCGIVIRDWGPDWTKVGNQSPKEMWYSFQCMYIPDDIAGECAEWFFNDAMKRLDPEYQSRIKRKKHDDDFFRYFMLEKHPYMMVVNLKPNIVDHIDYMIGGSLVNTNREKEINRAAYWEHERYLDAYEDRVLRYREENGL